MIIKIEQSYIRRFAFYRSKTKILKWDIKNTRERRAKFTGGKYVENKKSMKKVKILKHNFGQEETESVVLLKIHDTDQLCAN